jgi:hypothetical protein
MTIEQAKEIKEELKIYEGKTIGDSLKVWKVMICSDDVPLSTMITQCRLDFNYDDQQDGYDNNYDVYVLYNSSEFNFSHERAVKFWERLQAVG